MRLCGIKKCGYPVFGTDKETGIGYCHNHQWCRTDKKKPRMTKVRIASSKIRKPIKRISDKLSKEQKIYALRRRIYIIEHPNCEIRVEGCTKQTTEVHHSKGRGIYLNDISTWKPTCRNCHHWAELNPVEAKKIGASVSRLEK